MYLMTVEVHFKTKHVLFFYYVTAYKSYYTFKYFDNFEFTS